MKYIVHGIAERILMNKTVNETVADVKEAGNKNISGDKGGLF